MSFLSFIICLYYHSHCPHFMLHFREKEKNERHFYSYPHLLPGSPFLYMFSLFPKISYLKKLKMKIIIIIKQLTWKCGSYAKKTKFFVCLFLTAVGSAEGYLGLACQNEYQNQQKTFKSHPCINCGKCGFVRAWRTLRGVELINFKKPPDRQDLLNLKAWKCPTV